MSTQLSRRAFIASLGASFAPIQFACAGEPQQVVVIGAGLAGLAAAYELKQAGQNVVVLEQSDRVGGRVRTIRGHFDDDALIDVGAQSGGTAFTNFMHYCSTLGLRFEEQPTVAQRPDVLLHLQGKLNSAAMLQRDPASWPLDLHEDEKSLAPFRLLNHYLAPIAKDIRSVENVLDPEFLEYDAMSLRQLLELRGASDAAIKLIDHTLNYNSVDTVSSLSALRDAARTMTMRGSQSLRLAGGSSTLPEAFADALSSTVVLNHRLVSIDQRSNYLSLQVESNGKTKILHADRLIVAIPFTALRKVNISSVVPAGRRKIIEELPYTQVAQVHLQSRSRFWESDGPVSAIVSDGPLERLFNTSERVQGNRGMLLNWVNGTGTRGIRSDDPDEQVAHVIREMEEIWPNCRGQIEKSFAIDWGQTYAEGAYAHYAPRQMTEFAREIPKPIGQIHFAGEHTELVAPGMEGALTSGKRAAAEVLAALSAR